MRFIVEEEFFEKLPNACIGVVMARNIDNSVTYCDIDRLLDKNIETASQRFAGKKVKEDLDIQLYRNAFRGARI